jgi:2,4-dienoyl-CoA reductase-like NADH-dependent reductase (Old Yellow Enzyme family)
VELMAVKKLLIQFTKKAVKSSLQLMHADAFSQGNRFNKETLGPSAVQPKGEQMKFYGGEGPFPMTKEATKDDSREVIEGFVDAAKRAKEAGI